MLKKLRLTPKLSIIIGTAFTIVFCIMIVVNASMFKGVIQDGIAGELSAISESNATKIQQIFKAAEDSAHSIEHYLQQAYQLAELHPENNIPSTNPEVASICGSSLYPGKVLSSINYDAELFITQTARNVIDTNSDISAFGIMFEPNQFISDMESYGFFFTQKNRSETGFTSYSDYSSEESYRKAVDSKSTVITQPYEYEGELVLSLGHPLEVNGKIIGVVIANINVDGFATVDAKSEYYPTLWVTICDGDSNIIWDSETMDDVGKNIISDYTPSQSEQQDLAASLAAGTKFAINMTRPDGTKTTVFYSPINTGSEILWSSTGLFTSDAQHKANQSVLISIVLALVALIFILILVNLVLKRILQPIRDVVAAADSIVAGNLDIRLVNDDQDEIGYLSRTFQSMSETLRAIIADADYLLNEMANGNFRIRTREEERYVGEYRGILLAIRRINRTLSRTLNDINESSNQVASGSDQVASGAQALAQGATQQASSVQELAATITTISDQIARNADNALQASNKATIVRDHVLTSNQQMQHTLVAMNEIRNRSNEISKIIKTIEDIAFQTNILALNAAIEAARAGTAGKGFAVVAEEVRNLAAKSAEASQSTTALIEHSLAAIEQGTTSMDETAASMENVVSSVQDITDSIQQISQASEAQSDSISQINLGIDQISSVVQTNSAAAEQSAAASEELSAQSQTLKKLVGQFQLREDVETVQPSMEVTTPITQPIESAPNDYSVSTNFDKY